MNKKGFTLEELLAVIAILAILVIVAMPNVLGMFNQAKLNTFVTETQTIMSQSSVKFVSEALKTKGKELVFYKNSNEPDEAKKKYNELDMSGNEKNYFVKMNRNGEFVRVVVWDDNFCYDSGETTITKENILATTIHESTSNDGVKWSGNYIEGTYTNSSTFLFNGCSGTVDGILYGDVNGDGTVNQTDADLLDSYEAHMTNLDEEALKRADLNLDGVVNGKDSIILNRYVDGSFGIDSLPMID